ncbi:alpha/beta fold hydrolase, partial [Actinotignum timonense]|nr:alpha/beta fold hydrolase [Actinotignum timonense]
GLSGWQDLLLNHYRLVLLDERGTGNSYPLDSLTITAAGSPAAQAALLSCFRQDSIVNDAEHLRRHLQGDEPWSVLGQSFGGFAAVSYLSHAPAGLREVMITGGLPSLDSGPQAVYRQTFPREHRDGSGNVGDSIVRGQLSERTKVIKGHLDAVLDECITLKTIGNRAHTVKITRARARSRRLYGSSHFCGVASAPARIW